MHTGKLVKKKSLKNSLNTHPYMKPYFRLLPFPASSAGKTIYGLSALAFAILPFSARGAITIVLDENFAAGERSTQDLPNTSAWYGSDPNVSEIAGGIRLSTAGGSAHLFTYFTDSGTVSIGEGETLLLTYQFRFDGVINGSAAVRLGVFNSGASRVTSDSQGTANSVFEGVPGYGVFFNPNTVNTNGQNIRQRQNAGTQLLNAAGPWTGALVNGGSALQLANNTDYTGVFSISRTGADMGVVSHEIRSGTTSLTIVSHTIASGLLTDFNSFAIAGVGNNRPEIIELYSVGIAVIPEPSTYAAMVGLLVLGFVLVRRRARSSGRRKFGVVRQRSLGEFSILSGPTFR
jgi:hypothetical protein